MNDYFHVQQDTIGHCMNRLFGQGMNENGSEADILFKIKLHASD